MQQYHHIETITTSQPISVIELDDDINNVIRHSRMTEGFVIISSLHTTTAITVNEHEEKLLQFIKKLLERLSSGSQDNAQRHMLAMLLGSSETIPIANRKMQLGENQSVMLLDLDGPKKRSVNIHVLGEVSQRWQ